MQLRFVFVGPSISLARRIPLLLLVFELTSSWPACQVHLEQKNHLNSLNNFNNSDCSRFIAKLERLSESFYAVVLLMWAWRDEENVVPERGLGNNTSNRLLGSLCRFVHLPGWVLSLQNLNFKKTNQYYLTILWRLDNSVAFGFVMLMKYVAN